MNLSDLQQFGLIALIPVLTGVVVYLYQEVKKERVKVDAEKDARLTDAKESRDNMKEPLEKVTRLAEQTYDLLLKNNRGS